LAGFFPSEIPALADSDGVVRQPDGDSEVFAAEEPSGSAEWPRELLLSLLVRLNIRLQKALDLRFKPLGITAQEAALLLYCAEAGQTSPGRIAVSMGRDKGKITRFVDRLESAKLLSRMRSARDRRAFVIKVTKRAERLVPQLKIIFDETRAELFDEIPDGELARLGAAVSQMYSNVGQLRSRTKSKVPER
jgi:DNA-binding MarR family transcriptional regulator